MKFTNKTLILVVSPIIILAGALSASAADTHKSNTNNVPHDRVTADDQSMTSQRDTELTRQVRERIVKESGLSVAAKNITIVTINGRVTLSGSVANQTEKSKVESIAKTVNGATSVTNQTVISR